MKNNKYFLPTTLAATLGAILLGASLVRAFAPAVMIPTLDIPMVVLISLVALLLDHYLGGNTQRCYVCVAVFGVLSFGLLPFAACFVGLLESVKLGLIGGITFTLVCWVFTTMQDRLSTGPAAKFAPVLTALGLYLASQAFAGWIL